MPCIILAVALLQVLMVRAHAIVCSFSRSQRTWRHNRIRDAFAYAARQFKLQVYTNGRKDVQSSYEFSFKTDEYGVPTSKRSDLVVTDERGISYVLDVTICDSINALCVKHKAGGKAGSMPALQLLYNNTSTRTRISVTSMTLNSFRLPSTRSVACTRIRLRLCTTSSSTIDIFVYRGSAKHFQSSS